MNTKNKDEKPLFVLAEYKNPKYDIEKILGSRQYRCTAEC